MDERNVCRSLILQHVCDGLQQTRGVAELVTSCCQEVVVRFVVAERAARTCILLGIVQCCCTSVL